MATTKKRPLVGDSITLTDPMNLTINWGINSTIFGDIVIGVTTRGLCLLWFVASKDLATVGEHIHQKWPGATLIHNHDLVMKYAKEVTTRMSGGQGAVLPFDLYGSKFQLLVWQALLRIPEGQTCTYKQIAIDIGQPSASRAVGGALSSNPIGYLIPCHRVIHSSGKIGNYHWGSDRKRLMLHVESARNHHQGDHSNAIRTTRKHPHDRPPDAQHALVSFC